MIFASYTIIFLTVLHTKKGPDEYKGNKWNYELFIDLKNDNVIRHISKDIHNGLYVLISC